MNLKAAKNPSRIQDSKSLTKSEIARITKAYYEALDGPETASGEAVIRGYNIMFFLEIEDFDYYAITATNQTTGYEKSLYQASSDGDTTQDEDDVVPALDDALAIVEEFFDTIDADDAPTE